MNSRLRCESLVFVRRLGRPRFALGLMGFWDTAVLVSVLNFKFSALVWFLSNWVSTARLDFGRKSHGWLSSGSTSGKAPRKATMRWIVTDKRWKKQLPSPLSLDCWATRQPKSLMKQMTSSIMGQTFQMQLQESVNGSLDLISCCGFSRGSSCERSKWQISGCNGIYIYIYLHISLYIYK